MFLCESCSSWFSKSLGVRWVLVVGGVPGVGGGGEEAGEGGAGVDVVAL